VPRDGCQDALVPEEEELVRPVPLLVDARQLATGASGASDGAHPGAVVDARLSAGQPDADAEKSADLAPDGPARIVPALPSNRSLGVKQALAEARDIPDAAQSAARSCAGGARQMLKEQAELPVVADVHSLAEPVPQVRLEHLPLGTAELPAALRRAVASERQFAAS
jgi:hypothetical protein